MRLRAHAWGAPNAPNTLVALPGGLGLSHDYLEPLKRLASERLQVVLFDPRGTGESSAPEPPSYSLAAYDQDVDAVIAALGVSRVHLLGHSSGTTPAIEYAIAHPTRVASLILASSGAPDETDDNKAGDRLRQRIAALQARGVITKTIPEQAPGKDCRLWFEAIAPATFANPEHPAIKTFKLAGTFTCDAASAWDNGTTGWDFRKDLSKLTMPVLLIVGDGDFNDPEQLQRGIATVHPWTVVLPKCGHFPWIECPEPFFLSLSAFLDATAGSSSDPR